jgi:hypothetical protein
MLTYHGEENSRFYVKYCLLYCDIYCGNQSKPPLDLNWMAKKKVEIHDIVVL